MVSRTQLGNTCRECMYAKWSTGVSGRFLWQTSSMFLGSSRPSAFCVHERRRDFQWFRPARFWTCLVAIRLPTNLAATWESIVGRDWVAPPFMDPVSEVVSTSVSVSSIVSWCETDEATTNSPFTHLRNRRTMHHRVLAAMPHKTSPAPTSCWRLETTALLFPALLSQRGLLGQEARCRQTSDRNRCFCSSFRCVAPTRTGSWTGAEVRGRLCAVDHEVTAPIEAKILEAYDTFLRSERSWRGYCVGCILDAYHDLMFHYSRQYWAIQHQADVRARFEQLERLRREGLVKSGAIARASVVDGDAPTRDDMGSTDRIIRRPKRQHKVAGYSLCLAGRTTHAAAPKTDALSRCGAGASLE